MAFKREGDDLSQLAALRRRRVADLLASFIPEDEALLLNNGRYACSVCSRRPVFDTVDMLAVHRTGKKHIACLQRYYGKKRSLQMEIQKRQHQRHIREQETGSGARSEQDQLPPLLQRTREITRHALLKEAPYSSCCKRKLRCGGEGLSPSLSTSEAGAGTAGGVPTTAGSSSTASDTSAATTAADAGGEGSPGARARRRGKRGGRKSEETSASRSPDPERQRLAEYQLRLRSAGWIPDRCGRWVRDGAAEFDSDEEDPPPLPPPDPLPPSTLSPS